MSTVLIRDGNGQVKLAKLSWFGVYFHSKKKKKKKGEFHPTHDKKKRDGLL